MSNHFLTPNERRSRLEVAISDHVIKGYEVVDRELTWAEMYKPKRFSPRGCLLGLGIFYLMYYALVETEDAIYLEVTAQGDLVKRQMSIAQAAAKRSRRSKAQ
ncbi:MAG: hypothetical protein D6791_06120 [Chloroflexi bacterium]|nr:MAG: hypothetical protein D6791_06120 [Chloroflexota bacterium]